MDIQLDLKQLSEDYLRIEQAILYLENHYKDQPNLEEVAGNIGLNDQGETLGMNFCQQFFVMKIIDFVKFFPEV